MPLTRRRLLALAAVSPLLAACGETTAPQRLSQLWPEPPPDRAAALATAGWQGYWYARYVGGLIATQPGLGLPATTLDPRSHAAFSTARPGAIPIALPFATATVDAPTAQGEPFASAAPTVSSACAPPPSTCAFSRPWPAPTGCVRPRPRRVRPVATSCGSQPPTLPSPPKPRTVSTPISSAPGSASFSTPTTPTIPSATSTSSGPPPTRRDWRCRPIQ